MIAAKRYHDISCGHRVYGHENKCAHLHGHNYRVHFTVVPSLDFAELDHIGRVIDFSVIKAKLCYWLEENWDHKFLVWKEDPWSLALQHMDPDGVVLVPFNPTAENMAFYLVQVVAPEEMKGTGCWLKSVTIEETRKCSAEYVAEQQTKPAPF